MKYVVLGVCLCMVFFTGCTGGNKVGSYAIAQSEKPLKTKEKKPTLK